jgi:hypothetical protein
MPVHGYYLFELAPGGSAAHELETRSLHNAKQLTWRLAGEIVVRIGGNEERDVSLAAATLSKVEGVRSVRRLDSSAPNLEAIEWEVSSTREKCRAVHVDDPGTTPGKARRAFLDDAVRRLKAGEQAAEKLRRHLNTLDSAIRRIGAPLDALVEAWKAPAGDDADAAVLAGHAEARVKAALADIEELDASLKP